MGIVKDLVRRTAPMWLRHAVARRRTQLRKRRLFGALTPLVPEVADMFEGPGSYEEFKANGEEFLAIYQRVAGLTPNERFLDVGSGIGRKTIPLTQFLRSDAVYEGIDVNPAGIEWCRRKITPRFPNFRFQRIDVRNDLYNPTGTYEASEYRFPFPDESFTFVMLGSVFTHMLPRDVEHYLAEIHRVLAPGQRCLISYFLLNDESRRLIASNASTLAFHLDRDDYAPVNPARPEDAIALPEPFVKSAYERLGFNVARIEYGSWCGRAQYLSYQDLVLAVRQ
jgi:SAM-dependent methyltransferase